jgi:hypothetical protein
VSRSFIDDHTFRSSRWDGRMVEFEKPLQTGGWWVYGPGAASSDRVPVAR